MTTPDQPTGQETEQQSDRPLPPRAKPPQRGVAPKTAALAAGIAVVFIVATTTALLLGRAAGTETTDHTELARSAEAPGTSSTSAPDTSEGATPSPSDEGTTDEEPSAATRAADAAASQEVAVNFVRIWASPSIGRPPWLQRLEPLSSPAMFELLTYTDLDLVPTATVAGSRNRGVEYLGGHDHGPDSTHDIPAAEGLALVDLNTGATVQVWTQRQVDDTWVVTGIEPADTTGNSDPSDTQEGA